MLTLSPDPGIRVLWDHGWKWIGEEALKVQL